MYEFKGFFSTLTKHLYCFPFAVLMFHSNLASADENVAVPEEVSIESITVTATRQDTELLKTPIAITAFDMNDQMAGRFERMSDVANQTPDLIVENSGNAAFPIILIRGIGSTDTSMGSDPSIGFYVDDIYIGRAMGVINDLFDIEQVEVIKGPQGTLWGRNTLGGAINVVTRSPQKADRNELHLNVGNYSDFSVGGLISKTLNGKVSGKISFNHRNRDGYSTNIFDDSELNDIDNSSLRSSLSYRVNENSQWLFSGDLTRDRSSSAGFDPLITGRPISGGILGNISVIDAPFNHVEPISEYVVNHTPGAREHRDIYGFSGKYELNLDNYSFLSITAVRGIDFDNIEKTDGLSIQLIELFQQTDQQQFSQELRLTGASRSFQWTLGAYYFQEDIDDQLRLESQDFNLLLAGLAGSQDYSSINNSDLDVSSYAVYGNLGYTFENNIKVDFGLRYTTETKKYNFSRISNDVLELILAPSIPESDLKGSWNRPSPSITMSYAPNNQYQAVYYGSITTGFRSGGFNTLQTTLEEAFNEETLTAYQLGFKSQFLDKKLQLDLAAFHYDHKDLQVQTLVPQSTGTPTVITSNAAKTTEQGFDLSLIALPSDSLKVDASISFLDASYDEFLNANGIDVAGNQVKFSSKYSGVFGFEYSSRLSNDIMARFRMEYNVRSKIYFTEANLSELMQPGYSLINSYLEFSSDRYPIVASIYGKNLADKTVVSSETDFLNIIGTVTRVYRAPRTYGMQLKAHF